MNGIVYYIYHKQSGKGYVGRHNKPNLYARFKAHIKDSFLLGRTIRKYGKEEFKIVLLDTGISDEELNEKEIYWVDRLETLSPEGYNLTAGGKGTSGFNHSEETKRKLSILATNPSIERRIKQSLAQIGLPVHENTRKAQSIARKGISPANAQLTSEQVLDIRNSSDKSIWDWAIKLGVGYSVIASVRAYKTYKNVA